MPASDEELPGHAQALAREAAPDLLEGRPKMSKEELVEALERHGRRETAKARG